MPSKYKYVDDMLEHMKVLANHFEEHDKQLIKMFVAAIEALPYANVEKVKHCKGCIHWNSETKGCTRSPSVMPWLETDFCSYFDGGDSQVEA